MRVLIGIPYYRQIEPDTIRSLLAMISDSSGLPVSIEMKDSALTTHNRNHLIHVARDNGFSHILMVDADMAFPSDSLRRLISHDKDIVGATYAPRNGTGKPLGQPMQGERFPLSGLVEAFSLPAGFLLLRTSIFDHDKIGMPAFFDSPDKTLGQVTTEDYTFCGLCHNKGYKIWCDLDLSKQIGHIGKAQFYISPNALGIQLAQTAKQTTKDTASG